jgi:predicted nucleic acid-binding protein
LRTQRRARVVRADALHDLFHVAIAIEVGADGLLTFDREQQSLAEAAGVRVLKLGTRRRS